MQSETIFYAPERKTMPKINNNPIMKGARGMLGGVVVYRQFRGMTIMSNRPKKSKVITPHQQAIKSRFLLAVEYAKKQIADPELKAKYEPDPGSKFTSAYVAALADYLRRGKQNENESNDKKTENEEGSLEPKTDSRCAKIDVIEYSQNVAEKHEQHGRTATPFAHRYAVIMRYATSTSLSGRCVENSLLAAAKNQRQLSSVYVRSREPFARCFKGILRSREPTHAPLPMSYTEKWLWVHRA
jgi:hypothetical protein